MWDTDADMRYAIWYLVLKSVVVCYKKSRTDILDPQILSQLTKNFSKAIFDRLIDLDWESGFTKSVYAIYIFCGLIESSKDIFELDPDVVAAQATHLAYNSDTDNMYNWFYEWDNSYNYTPD